MRRLIEIIIVFTASGLAAIGQIYDNETVQFTPDFRFKDGIYVEFDQVRENSPIPKSKILTSADYNDRDFFNTILDNDKIYFYDGIGIRQEIDKSEIWGYSRNGILYVQVQGNFNRITFVGSLCHFVADITTYDRRYYGSPYGNYDPYYYSPYNYSNYNSYYSPYYMPYRPTSVSKNELVQYVLDFESGKIIEYNVKNVGLLIMKDPELHSEFQSLSRKKQKQMLFLYIRRFNEKNPLYLPKN